MTTDRYITIGNQADYDVFIIIIIIIIIFSTKHLSPLALVSDANRSDIIEYHW